MVPVQSGFTVYVPVPVISRMLPFWLAVAAKLVPPFPSKVCVPTSTNGPAAGDGGAMDPVPVYAKVPCTTALEQPLSSAFAVGATPSASTVSAAIVRVIVMVLRFMIVSFAFIMESMREENVLTGCSLSRRCRRKRTAKAATFCNYFCKGEGVGGSILRGNHASFESLERRRPHCPGAAGGTGVSGIAPDGPPLYEE